MLEDKLRKDINKALKEKDDVRLSTLKMLSSALHNAKIEKRDDLNKEEELVVVKKEAKKRKDAIEAYKKGGAKDRAKREEEELKILQEFLPEEMTDSELEKLVNESISEVKAESMADVGKTMGSVMAKVKGQADGTRVSAMVKEKLEK